MNVKEYVVTLWDRDELLGFYDDMENPCPDKPEIPTRSCKCTDRHPISRNTDYELRDTEIEKLMQDGRVRDVAPKDVLTNSKVKARGYTQTSDDWDRSTALDREMKNWGLPRCINGQTTGWGSDDDVAITATITTTNTAANVDVVIVDGHLDPDHPEFARNADGTGGSRVVQFNWFSLNPIIDGSGLSTYTYPTGSALHNDDDNHGQHVAATVAGNTQGWARDASIYNISPYASNPNTLAASVFEYVRVFHEQKAPDPVTGLKRPTVMNNSWALIAGSPEIGSIINVNHQGNTQSGSGTFTENDLDTYGLVDRSTDGVDTFVDVELWSSAYAAEVEDAIDSGVIVFGAAGNGQMRLAVDGDVDYDNTIMWQPPEPNANISFYYHRGASNVTAGNSVVVGAASSLKSEYKATFSSTGPRVDLYAPGENIMSAIHYDASQPFVSDPRDTSYRLQKQNGTSMASPQVAGLIACWLEQNPRAKQDDVVNYLTQHQRYNEMLVTSGGYTDNTSLQGGENNYLRYHYDRPLNTGMMTPRKATKARPSSGMVYPRPQAMAAQG